MTTDAAPITQPLWLAMESRIRDLSSSALEAGTREQTIQQLATALDGMGFNVSRHAGHMLDLRSAIDARVRVGHPMLEDLDAAISALKLEDVADTLRATVSLATSLGEAWPRLKESARRPDILRIVERTRLDLLVAEAKGMADDKGVRFLIAQDVASQEILDGLGISEERLHQVRAAIAEERAAVARVERLLEKVEGQPDPDRAKHLIDNDVPDELIVQVAGIEPSVIEAARKAMEAELAEKKRLEEEAAARKKAEAEGPPLEDIPADQLADFVEEIKEIMEFTQEEKEIRQMCEASKIPRCLVDIAVTDPDKLDELEG